MKKVALIFGVMVTLIGAVFVIETMDSGPPPIAGSLLPSSENLPAVTLEDLEGNKIGPESLKGRWTLVYLGFTQCPDACPTSMTYFKGELNALAPEVRSKVRILLISVDPDRDDRETLRKYVKGFHNDLDAARGEESEVLKLAKALYTTFHKEEIMSDNLYMVAHSPRYYLLNPEGKFFAYYEPPIEKGRLSKDLDSLVRWKNMI